MRGAILAASVSLLFGGQLEAQQDQRALAERLLRGSEAERHQALDAIRVLGPQRTGPDLRRALFQALEAESRNVIRRAEAGRRGEPLGPVGDPEFMGEATSLVAALKDPAAIPVLAGTLGSGFTTINALAAFGDRAAPEVLAVVTSPATRHYAVNDGLIALRFMVEGAGAPRLPAARMEQVRRAAEQRLNEKQAFISTTWWAIDLAGVLDDPALRRTLQTLASDESAVRAKGIADPALIRQTQRRAADRLAGIPPLPRWAPSP